jgi:hypothetical protein
MPTNLGTFLDMLTRLYHRYYHGLSTLEMNMNAVLVGLRLVEVCTSMVSNSTLVQGQV